LKFDRSGFLLPRINAAGKNISGVQK